MTDQLLRHMACDRCGEAWTGPASVQPNGWIGLLVTSPPLGTPEDDRSHLCGKCDADLARFLSNWKVVRHDEP